MARSLDQSLMMIKLTNIINGIPEELLTEDLINEVNEISPSDRAGINKACAEYHGIGVDLLISSPNMQLLITQYFENIVEKSVIVFCKAGLTEEQARAFISYGMLNES